MALAAKVIKRTKDSVQFKISEEHFESCCDSIGSYRQEVLAALAPSPKDHRAGRVTKRQSLRHPSLPAHIAPGEIAPTSKTQHIRTQHSELFTICPTPIGARTRP